MPEQTIKDKTAIAGIGWTAFSRKSGVTTLTLAAEASLKAIADAGLQVQDIDGVVSFYHRQPEGQMVRELVRALGLKKCNFEFYSDGGGGWNCGAVLSGAMLVHSGICKNVLVFKARNRYSQGRAARAERANDVKGDAQFTTPFGIHHAAASFGPIATAHMARYGTTTLGLRPSRRHRAQSRRTQPKGDDAQAHHHRRPSKLALDHLSFSIARLLPGK